MIMQRFPRQGHGSIRRTVILKRRIRRTVFLLVVMAVMATMGAKARTAELQPVLKGTTHQAYFDLSFYKQKGLAVGASGELLKTLDGGREWRRQRLDKVYAAILGVAVLEDRSLVVGQGGVILISEEENRWRRVNSPTEARLFSVAANNAGLAAAVGEFGAILISGDGGRHWRKLNVDWASVLSSQGGLLVEPHLYAVHVDETGTITLAGEFGLIMRSADMGGSWKVLHQAEASIFSLEFTADGLGYAVGQDGFAVESRDGGETWLSLDIGSEANLLDIGTTDDGRIVVSGIREFWQSTDFGKTWARMRGEDIDRKWYTAVASNGNGEIYVVGQGASVLKLDR